MLGDKRVMTAIPVRDVDRARGFYEGPRPRREVTLVAPATLL